MGSVKKLKNSKQAKIWFQLRKSLVVVKILIQIQEDKEKNTHRPLHFSKARETKLLFVLVKEAQPCRVKEALQISIVIEALHLFVSAKEALDPFFQMQGAPHWFNKMKGAPQLIDIPRTLHLAA